jgi:hypothetical protein
MGVHSCWTVRPVVTMGRMSDADVRRYIATEIKVTLMRRQHSPRNQRELAQAIGMSLGTLSNKMTARMPFTTDDLYVIARVLDVDMVKLLPTGSVTTI